MKQLTLTIPPDVHKSLAAAAKDRGIELHPEQALLVVSPNGLFANSAVSGAGDLTETQLKAGANLLFTYFHLPAEASTARLPTGFYLIRVRLGEDLKSGDAQFLDKSGTVVKSVPLEVTTHPIAAPAISLSGSFSRCHVSGDITIRGIQITVTIRWC